MANGSQQHRRRVKARTKKSKIHSGRFKVKHELGKLQGRVDRGQLDESSSDDKMAAVLESDYTTG